MSLAPKLAFRNLFQDRLRLIATVVGIGFSMVLVTIQMGLYVSFETMVTVMIDHARADLWIVPRGSKSFHLWRALPAGAPLPGQLSRYSSSEPISGTTRSVPGA